MALFGKKDTSQGEADKAQSKQVSRNWYADRYETAIVWRNLFFLTTVASIVIVFFSVWAVESISTGKTIEPFVIEIEEKSGVTNVVVPLKKERYSTREAVRDYFLVKYVTARETYFPFSADYNYNTVVRILSSSAVYSRFRRLISAGNPNSPIRKGGRYSLDIKISSISYLPQSGDSPGITAQVRFLTFVRGQSQGVRKLATINFDFRDIPMNKEERYINPLGFQVTGYSVSDETL